MALASCYPIEAKAEFFILKHACIIDRQGETINALNRKLITTRLADGSVQLERFIIKEDNGSINLSYQTSNSEIEYIGNLKQGWIQNSDYF